MADVLVSTNRLTAQFKRDVFRDLLRPNFLEKVKWNIAMFNQINSIVAIILLLTVVLFTSCDNQPATPNGPLQKITIATMPSSFTGYTIFVARNKGFFQDAGFDVTLDMSFPHGKATLKALDEKANFAVSSETPFVNAVLNGAEISTIVTTVTAHNHLAVVARQEKGITTGGDLKGKTVGVTLGSNGEYFLDLVLLTNGLTKKDINTKDIKPKGMVDSLKSGDVDAISTWNPNKSRAIEMLGDQGVSIIGEGIYSPFFIVVAKKEYISANPEIVKKITLALQKSTNFIQSNRDDAREIVSKYLKTEPSFLKELEATYIFELSLEQAFINTLEGQAKWALRNKPTSQSTIPNFLEFIYTDALESILPDQMTIIK